MFEIKENILLNENKTIQNTNTKELLLKTFCFEITLMGLKKTLNLRVLR